MKAILLSIMCLLLFTGCGLKTHTDTKEHNLNMNNEQTAGKQGEQTEGETPIEKEHPTGEAPTIDPDTADNVNPNNQQSEKTENKNYVTTQIEHSSSDKLIVTYTNNTEQTILYGRKIELQQFVQDIWVDIPMLPDVGWHDDAMILDKENSREESIDLKLFYGTLESGHYRIIKEMFNDDISFDVIFEFDID